MICLPARTRQNILEYCIRAGIRVAVSCFTPKFQFMPMARREICRPLYNGCHWVAILRTSRTSGTPCGDDADISAGKGKGGRVHALNAYSSRGITPLILNIGAGWNWVVNATPWPWVGPRADTEVLKRDKFFTFAGIRTPIVQHHIDCAPVVRVLKVKMVVAQVLCWLGAQLRRYAPCTTLTSFETKISTTDSSAGKSDDHL